LYDVDVNVNINVIFDPASLGHANTSTEGTSDEVECMTSRVNCQFKSCGRAIPGSNQQENVRKTRFQAKW
jgi:hypothetical protein